MFVIFMGLFMLARRVSIMPFRVYPEEVAGR